MTKKSIPISRAENMSIDDAILCMHEMSVSGNPRAQSFGRLMKLMIPLLQKWAADERSRTDFPGPIRFEAAMMTIAPMLVSVAGTIAGHIMNRDVDAKVLAVIKKDLVFQFERSIAMMEAEASKVKQ